MRGDLPVGWVVGCFETDDPRFERRIARVEKSEERQLGGRWSEDEDLLRVLQGAGKLAEETGLVVGVIARPGSASVGCR